MSITENYVVITRNAVKPGIDISSVYGPFSYGEARAAAEPLRAKYLVDVVQLQKYEASHD